MSINGQLATVSSGGQFFLNDLNLQAGANTVTATVTTADGQTANQVTTITRSVNVPLFEVTVGQGGIVIPGTPVDVDVTLASAANTPFATINIDCVSPSGGSDVAQLGTYQCTYANPGTYEVKVTVKNPGGGTIYSGMNRVTVKSAAEHIASVRAVYTSLTDRLKAGDKTAALNLFFGTAREKYDDIFTKLGSDLALVAGQLGSIASVTALTNAAEVTITRDVGGAKQIFMIYLMLGEDGVWRIESM